MGFWEGLKIGFLTPRAGSQAAERGRRSRIGDPAAGLTRTSDPNAWLTALWAYVVEIDRTLAWIHWDLPHGGQATDAAVHALLAATKDARAFTAFHAGTVPPKLSSLFSRVDVLAARWTHAAEDWTWTHDMAQLATEFEALGSRWAAIGDELHERWVMPRARKTLLLPASEPVGTAPTD